MDASTRIARPLLAACAAAAILLATLLAAPRPAESQGAPPQLPPREEIERRVKEELQKLPEKTAELEGIKITYKAVPSDPAELIKRGVPVPAGMNVDQLLKQYGPMVQPIVNQYMNEIGKLKTDKELKFRSKKIAPGEYTFGIAFEQVTPIGVVIRGGDLKSPIAAKLKAKRVAVQRELEVAIEKYKDKDGEFVILIGFNEWKGPTEKWTASK